MMWGPEQKKKPTTVVLEVMRIEEIETADKKIQRTWSYAKRELLPKPQIVDSDKNSATLKSIHEKAESEVNLLTDNSYLTRTSSPLAHQLKQKNIDKREKLHLN